MRVQSVNVSSMNSYEVTWVDLTMPPNEPVEKEPMEPMLPLRSRSQR